MSGEIRQGEPQGSDSDGGGNRDSDEVPRLGVPGTRRDQGLVRVLVIGASADLSLARAVREASAIERLAGSRIAVSPVLDAKVTYLRSVASFRPDIVHFICDADGDRLRFDGEHGEDDYVPAARVAELLRLYGSPQGVRLRGIVLAACDGETLAPYFSGVADTVIAHRGRLSDGCGLAFAEQFYRLLDRAAHPPERSPATIDLAGIAREAAQLASYAAACEPATANLIAATSGAAWVRAPAAAPITVRGSKGFQAGDHNVTVSSETSAHYAHVTDTDVIISYRGGTFGMPPRQAGVPGPDPGRSLKGQCPDSVGVGAPFSVLASIVRDGTGGALLKPFPVGPAGKDILLVLHAPGLQVLSGQRRVVRVPPGADSEPVMFELKAAAPGPYRMSITAWLGGTYLGELTVETTADRERVPGDRHRDFLAAIGTAVTEGAVSLVVRYDPVQNAYRFEFRDDDNPDEVPSQLAYQPGPRVEHLVGELDRLTKDRAGFTAAETRDYLREAGIGLWSELLPEQLRRQFWERQHRISQLTILADRDTVPWELLYPFDPGSEAGFLVEQFPVTRMVFRHRPSRSLSLSPPWFVLPDGSPTLARDEVTELLRLLRAQPRNGPEPVIGGLTPLLELIRAGDFGLLHFACHNAFDPLGGSAISLDRRQFTPTHMNSAAIGRALARSAPTVFINACRSAGARPSYLQLDGWAGKFIEAGAGAFIGTLWAVRDSTAREFARELYAGLQAGKPLGQAVMQARIAAASEPGDPTWLAYAAYGDPRAALR